MLAIDDVSVIPVDCPLHITTGLGLAETIGIGFTVIGNETVFDAPQAPLIVQLTVIFCDGHTETVDVEPVTPAGTDDQL